MNEHNLPYSTEDSCFPEVRQNLRRAVQMDATIEGDTNRRGAAVVADLSTSGALLKQSGETFNVGEMVNVSLHGRRGMRTVELTFSATVVRIDGGNIAVRFGRYDNVRYTGLTDALYGQ